MFSNLTSYQQNIRGLVHKIPVCDQNCILYAWYNNILNGKKYDYEILAVTLWELASADRQ